MLEKLIEKGENILFIIVFFKNKFLEINVLLCIWFIWENFLKVVGGFKIYLMWKKVYCICFYLEGFYVKM